MNKNMKIDINGNSVEVWQESCRYRKCLRVGYYKMSLEQRCGMNSLVHTADHLSYVIRDIIGCPENCDSQENLIQESR